MERRHRLPRRVELRCLLCQTVTGWPLDRLAADEEPLLCSGCGNDVDPRIQRDLRDMARAILSLQAFLPEGPLSAPPRREKSWNVHIESLLPEEPGHGPSGQR